MKYEFKPMLHLLVRAEITHVPTDEELRMWLDSLVISQGMKIVIPTRVYYVADEDNRGPTGSCNLSTSHASFHIWDNKYPKLLQFDFFTCGDINLEAILNNIKLTFQTTDDHINYLLLDRQQKTFNIQSYSGDIGLTVISIGGIGYKVIQED